MVSYTLVYIVRANVCSLLARDETAAKAWSRPGAFRPSARRAVFAGGERQERHGRWTSVVGLRPGPRGAPPLRRPPLRPRGDSAPGLRLERAPRSCAPRRPVREKRNAAVATAAVHAQRRLPSAARPRRGVPLRDHRRGLPRLRVSFRFLNSASVFPPLGVRGVRCGRAAFRGSFARSPLRRCVILVSTRRVLEFAGRRGRTSAPLRPFEFAFFDMCAFGGSQSSRVTVRTRAWGDLSFAIISRRLSVVYRSKRSFSRSNM